MTRSNSPPKLLGALLDEMRGSPGLGARARSHARGLILLVSWADGFDDDQSVSYTVHAHGAGSPNAGGVTVDVSALGRSASGFGWTVVEAARRAIDDHKDALEGSPTTDR